LKTKNKLRDIKLFFIIKLESHKKKILVVTLPHSTTLFLLISNYNNVIHRRRKPQQQRADEHTGKQRNLDLIFFQKIGFFIGTKWIVEF